MIFSLPSYGKPFLIFFIIRLDGLFLGFLLALILVKIKYFDPNSYIPNKMFRYVKKHLLF